MDSVQPDLRTTIEESFSVFQKRPPKLFFPNADPGDLMPLFRLVFKNNFSKNQNVNFTKFFVNKSSSIDCLPPGHLGGGT